MSQQGLVRPQDDHISVLFVVFIVFHLMKALPMQVNPRYIPQLLEVLKWPQSLGIVGGRPSSSLYFIGCQGEQVLYLDPHDVQEVSTSGPSSQALSGCQAGHKAECSAEA